jgi:PAS domain S-box-containing protein
MSELPVAGDEIGRLLYENEALCVGLGILRRMKPEGAITLEWLEKQNEVLKWQLEQYQKNRVLLETDAGKQEILFRLQFLDSIPLPTWAADASAKIVFWAGSAEQTYGHIKTRALQKDFIDLFVNGPEKKQAREDLLAIVSGQEGSEHFNLCKDKDKNGKQVYLVTCCFPVFDPRTGEIVQAEVSFDLSRLDALEEELEEMHKRYRAEEEGARAMRMARERTIVESLTRELFSELKQNYDHRRQIIERRIRVNREKIADDRESKSVKEFHQKELEKSAGELQELDLWEADTKAEIARADTSENLQSIKNRLREWSRRNV